MWHIRKKDQTCSNKISKQPREGRNKQLSSHHLQLCNNTIKEWQIRIQKDIRNRRDILLLSAAKGFHWILLQCQEAFKEQRAAEQDVPLTHELLFHVELIIVGDGASGMSTNVPFKSVFLSEQVSKPNVTLNLKDASKLRWTLWLCNLLFFVVQVKLEDSCFLLSMISAQRRQKSSTSVKENDKSKK